MIYKNATIYQFASAYAATAATPTQAMLEGRTFAPCTAQQAVSMGWTPINEGDDTLTRELGTGTQFCLLIEERILPTATVNQALAERVKEIEAAQGRKVFRKERITLKDDIIMELLPRAFTKQKRIHAHIDTLAGILVIDTASTKVAEDLMGILRDAVGSLPVTLLESEAAARFSALTRGSIGNITATDEARLEHPGEPGTVAIKYEPLDSEEVQAHLNAGMVPSQIRAIFGGFGAATITDTLALRRIKLNEEMIKDAQGDATDRRETEEADFLLTLVAIRDMYSEMTEHFGMNTQTASAA